MFSACVVCEGHGPIEIELTGYIPRDHPKNKADDYINFDHDQIHVCAYCKSDLEDIDTLEVTKLPAGTI